ncbi:MAG: hypothetical protein E7170_03040 [Firmicutes bacterium]|nr:hypothetical protein [Bacillota bacterium]
MKKVKIIIFAIFFLAFITFLPTLGKYVGKGIKNYYLNSKNFYFNSDKLKEDGIVYQVENWSGVDSYSVTFNMNSYKNNIVYSESDIAYDISYKCSSNVTCEITKSNGVIPSNKHTDSFIITLTPKSPLNDNEKATIEVETTSTSPYKKTLKGIFNIVVGKMGLSYEINDEANSPFFEVAVTNTLDYYVVRTDFDKYKVGDKIDMRTYLSFSDIEKSYCASSVVTVEFDPNIVLLDMTSTAYLNSIEKEEIKIKNDSYINKISFKIDALSSYKVKFYKVDSKKDYTYPFLNNESIVDVSFD